MSKSFNGTVGELPVAATISLFANYKVNLWDPSTEANPIPNPDPKSQFKVMGQRSVPGFCSMNNEWAVFLNFKGFSLHQGK